MRIFAATLGFYTFLVLGSFVFGSLAMLGALVMPWSDAPLLCARWWSRGMLLFGGVKVEAHGAEQDFLRDGRIVVLVNHQSIYDIPVLFATLPSPAVFLAKRSLFWIPIFGWALWMLGFVPVDRGDRSKARDAYSGAFKALNRGRSLIIFPEGSRSPDGRIQQFKAGGVRIAKATEVPLVVAGISKTRAVRGKRSLIVRPGTVEIRYGELHSVDEIQSTPRARLVAQLRQEIATLSGEEIEGAGEPKAAVQSARA